MADLYSRNANSIDAPASRAAAITASDTGDVANTTKALYIGTGGSLKVELTGMAPGAFVIFTNIPDGSLLPVRVRKIWDLGTTASNFIGLY
jgi:hypothetical protein